MPYIQCPTCSLSTFTVAHYSSRDDCPRCGTELSIRTIAVPPLPLAAPSQAEAA